MNKLSILKSKLSIFCIQISLLSLLLYIFRYKITIDFDKGVSSERKDIIQFIANYVIYDASGGFEDFFFIYACWLFAAIIPILLLENFKKVYSLNLTTFFFPNFFFYVFLSRYSPNYFEENFVSLFIQTILLGIIIAIFSVGGALILDQFRKSKHEIHPEDIKKLEQRISSKCPHCGTEFDSKPLYCYKCSSPMNDR
ncbi:MAG: hypothetical protein ACTSR8_11220 [Promethearchaeota archaeon]